MWRLPRATALLSVLVFLGCGDDPPVAGPGPAGPGATTTGAGAGPGASSGAGASGGASGAGGSSSDPELDALLEDAMTTGYVPGLSAAILRGGDVVWTGAYGLADVDQAKPVTPDTLFLIASISKTVVSIALMQLVEQGLLSLDDAVSTLLPFDVQHPDHPSATITVGMLATHTSSIRDDWDTLEAHYVDGDSPITLRDYLEGYLVPGGRFYDATTNFTPDEPGTSWEYCNMAVSLAAYVVEHVSGVPFDEYCEANIFSPLQMNETAWRISDLDPAHVALPYQTNGSGYQTFGHFGYPDYPDGMLRTSAPQLGRFLGAFIHDGTLDGMAVLSAATVQAMRAPQVPDLDPTQALIWYYQGDTLGHDGGDPGVATSMFYRPSDGTGVIFLMNAEPADATWLAIEQALWDKADRL